MAESGVAAGPGPLEPLVALGRELRARGLPVGTGRILTFCRAVATLGRADRDSLYWAGRASLVARPDDIGPFDLAFDDWFRGLAGSVAGPRIELTIPTPRDPVERGVGDPPDDLEVGIGTTAAEWHATDQEPETDEEASIRIVASTVEVLRRRSFAELSGEEPARGTRLIR